MKIKNFILGKSVTPSWFNDICLTGKAKINKDDEGNIIFATLHTPTGMRTAKVGDTIMYTNSGLAVIPQDKARKYGVQHNVKEKNDNKKGIQQTMDE